MLLHTLKNLGTFRTTFCTATDVEGQKLALARLPIWNPLDALENQDVDISFMNLFPSSLL